MFSDEPSDEPILLKADKKRFRPHGIKIERQVFFDRENLNLAPKLAFHVGNNFETSFGFEFRVFNISNE